MFKNTRPQTQSNWVAQNNSIPQSRNASIPDPVQTEAPDTAPPLQEHFDRAQRLGHHPGHYSFQSSFAPTQPTPSLSRSTVQRQQILHRIASHLQQEDSGSVDQISDASKVSPQLSAQPMIQATRKRPRQGSQGQNPAGEKQLEEQFNQPVNSHDGEKGEESDLEDSPQPPTKKRKLTVNDDVDDSVEGSIPTSEAEKDTDLDAPHPEQEESKPEQLENDTVVEVTLSIDPQPVIKCRIRGYDQKQGKYRLQAISKFDQSLANLDIHLDFGSSQTVFLSDRNDFKISETQDFQSSNLAPPKESALTSGEIFDYTSNFSNGAWLIANDPLLFGTLMTPGGQVTGERFSEVAKHHGVNAEDRPTQRGGKKKRAAIVGQDTYGMLATRDEIAGLSEGWRVLPTVPSTQAPDTGGEETALTDQGTSEDLKDIDTDLEDINVDKEMKELGVIEDPEKTDPINSETKRHQPQGVTLDELGNRREKALTDFRDQFIFQQTSLPQRNRQEKMEKLGISLEKDYAPNRKGIHAEAIAVHSESWENLVANKIDQFSFILESFLGENWRETVPGLLRKGEIEDPTLLQLITVLSLQIKQTILLALNRTSCGSGSGYGGGCAAELSKVLEEVWGQVTETLGSEITFLIRQLGMMEFELSVAAKYSKSGKIDQMEKAGWKLGLHPSYDFDNDRVNPLNKNQLGLINDIKATRSEHTGLTQDQRKGIPDALIDAVSHKRGGLRDQLYGLSQTGVDREAPAAESSSKDEMDLDRESATERRIPVQQAEGLFRQGITLTHHSFRDLFAKAKQQGAMPDGGVLASLISSLGDRFVRALSEMTDFDRQIDLYILQVLGDFISIFDEHIDQLLLSISSSSSAREDKEKRQDRSPEKDPRHQDRDGKEGEKQQDSPESVPSPYEFIGQHFTIGSASGSGNNCLISTLFQLAYGFEPDESTVSTYKKGLVDMKVLADPDSQIGLIDSENFAGVYLLDLFGLHIRPIGIHGNGELFMYPEVGDAAHPLQFVFHTGGEGKNAHFVPLTLTGGTDFDTVEALILEHIRAAREEGQ